MTITTRPGSRLLAMLIASVLSATAFTAATNVPAATGAQAQAPTPGWVPELSTERTNVYLQDDGTYRAEAFAMPVNYIDAQGQLEHIDNDLVPSPGEDYAVENAENDYTLRLPEDASEDPVRFASGGHWAAFDMAGLDGSPAVDGAEATYTNAGSTASEVIYEARPDGVKESIVLSEPPTEDVEFDFHLDLSPGLTPLLRSDTGVIDVVTATGRTAFTMPAPVMTDAAGALSTRVEYQLTRAQDVDWRLEVRPSRDWLSSPGRTYPVIVDPTVTEPSSQFDGWITENAPTSVNIGGNYLRVGGLAGSRKRALLQFTLGQIPVNATVSSAVLKLNLDASLTTGGGSMDVAARMVVGSEPWDRTFLTWNRRQEYAAWSTPGGAWTGNDPAITLGGTTSGYKALDATLAVKHWINDGWTNNGFLVKAIGDVDKTLWFYSNNSTDGKTPALVVTYSMPTNTAPSVPSVALAAASCLGPCTADWFWTASLTPTLTAVANDSDTSTLTTSFEIRDPASGSTLAASPSLSGTQATPQSWPVPAGTLADHGAYEVRASVSDGATTRWSAWTPLNVDVDSPPTSPSGLAISPCAGTCPSLVSTSLRPTLSGEVSDTDSDFLTSTIELRTASSATIIATSGPMPAVDGQQVAWTVPESKLVDGGQYKYRVRVDDGSSVRTGAWTDFSVALPTVGSPEPVGFAVTPCTAPCSTWAPESITPRFAATMPSSAVAPSTVRFQLRSPIGETLEQDFANIAPGASATWQVPAGQLGGGNTYEARVGATASGASEFTWSGWRPLTVVAPAGAGVGEPALDTSATTPDDPPNLTDAGITEITEDETTAAPTFTDSDLDAIDAAADAEYKQLVSDGVVDPESAANRAVPIQLKYAPILFIHPDEKTGPMSALTTMKHGDLKWSHEDCRDDVDESTIVPNKLGNGTYGHHENGSFCNGHTGDYWHSNDYVAPKYHGGPTGNEGYYININDKWRESGVGEEPVYWDYVTTGTHPKLVYYFHYGYSRLHTSLAPGHEGDWESVEIQFYKYSDGHTAPWFVNYNYHHDQCFLYWGEAPKKNGKHIRVAVGLESHGNYPTGSIPHVYPTRYDDDIVSNLTDGPKWYAAANLDKAKAQDWYGYGGIWGDNGNFKDTSGPLPPGPKRDYEETLDPRNSHGKCEMR